MERRSFVKKATAAGVLTAGGPLASMMAQTQFGASNLNGKPYHYQESLEKTRQIPGLLLQFMVTKEQTGGAYSLMMGQIRKGAEPAMHVHEYEDEAFFVLEGEMIVTIGKEDYHVRPGEYIFLPRRIPHTQKLISDTVKTLLFISPAGLEQYFWDLSAPATNFEIPELPTVPPTAEQMNMIMEMSAKYGISPA